jgi:hypothetical protein
MPLSPRGSVTNRELSSKGDVVFFVSKFLVILPP